MKILLALASVALAMIPLIIALILITYAREWVTVVLIGLLGTFVLVCLHKIVTGIHEDLLEWYEKRQK